jgi:hypothetical protein
VNEFKVLTDVIKAKRAQREVEKLKKSKIKTQKKNKRAWSCAPPPPLDNRFFI